MPSPRYRRVTAQKCGDVLDLILPGAVGAWLKICRICPLFGPVRAFWLKDD